MLVGGESVGSKAIRDRYLAYEKNVHSLRKKKEDSH